MARQERAERTRNAILDAAAAVFDEHGFQGASLSDILAKAGATKGALYFHFSSKEELAYALIDDEFSVTNPVTDRGPVGLQTAIDTTHSVAHYLRTNVRVRASIRLIIEQGTYADPNPQAYQRWIEVGRDFYVAAQEQGDLRADLNPDHVASLVLSFFTGVQISSQVLTRYQDLHDRITDMWTMLLPGLVPPRRVGRFIPSGTVRYDPTTAIA